MLLIKLGYMNYTATYNRSAKLGGRLEAERTSVLKWYLTPTCKKSRGYRCAEVLSSTMTNRRSTSLKNTQHS
eukprot:218595-Amphidinium_carterae.1